jgi:hypothetical protein
MSVPAQQSQSQSSSIRRASEDARLRDFLSTHFDAQAHVTGVMREGRAEQEFATISACIEEVSEGVSE